MCLKYSCQSIITFHSLSLQMLWPITAALLARLNQNILDGRRKNHIFLCWINSSFNLKKNFLVLWDVGRCTARTRICSTTCGMNVEKSRGSSVHIVLTAQSARTILCFTSLHSILKLIMQASIGHILALNVRNISWSLCHKALFFVLFNIIELYVITCERLCFL